MRTAIRAAIGIAVNALILPPVHLRNVRENLSGLACGAQDALARMAEALVHEDWSEETAADWRRLSDRLQQRQESLRSARLWSDGSPRLGEMAERPRGQVTKPVRPGSRGGGGRAGTRLRQDGER